MEHNRTLLETELSKHQKKIQELVTQLEHSKISISQMETARNTLEKEIEFEKGVIQALEFAKNFIPAVEHNTNQFGPKIPIQKE